MTIINILNKIKKEKYCEIKDNFGLYNKFKIFNIKCFSCDSIDHSIKNCPLINKNIYLKRLYNEILSNRFSKRKILTRKKTKTKHPFLYNNEYLKISQKKNLTRKNLMFQKKASLENISIISDDFSPLFYKNISFDYINKNEKNQVISPIKHKTLSVFSLKLSSTLKKDEKKKLSLSNLKKKSISFEGRQKLNKNFTSRNKKNSKFFIDRNENKQELHFFSSSFSLSSFSSISSSSNNNNLKTFEFKNLNPFKKTRFSTKNINRNSSYNNKSILVTNNFELDEFYETNNFLLEFDLSKNFRNYFIYNNVENVCKKLCAKDDEELLVQSFFPKRIKIHFNFKRIVNLVITNMLLLKNFRIELKGKKNK